MYLLEALEKSHLLSLPPLVFSPPRSPLFRLSCVSDFNSLPSFRSYNITHVLYHMLVEPTCCNNYYTTYHTTHFFYSTKKQFGFLQFWLVSHDNGGGLYESWHWLHPTHYQPVSCSGFRKPYFSVLLLCVQDVISGAFCCSSFCIWFAACSNACHITLCILRE